MDRSSLEKSLLSSISKPTMEDEDANVDPLDNMDPFMDEPMLSLEGGIVTTIEEGADDKSPESEKSHFRQTASAILNKLNPYNVDHVAMNLTAIPITSEGELKTCMELIYEIAINKTNPTVAELCAKLCQVIQMRKVVSEKSKTETVNFRKLLISHCQKEFENANNENQEETLIDQEEALTLKKRRLGNIIFVGELYKVEMLTAIIMHSCLEKLLKMRDEESLECLCKLLMTVGKKLNVETKRRLSKDRGWGSSKGVKDLSVYLNEMKKIKNDKQRASQMIQGVLKHLQ